MLRGLDEAIADMHTDTLATAAVARLERTDGDGWTRLRWANAGHPPPMVLRPDGEVSVLGGAIGDLMLGVDRAAERVESVFALAPGAVVLLYSDGLVERRGEHARRGHSPGWSSTSGNSPDDRSTSSATPCSRRMLHGTPEDDVALVAVRIHPRDATPR